MSHFYVAGPRIFVLTVLDPQANVAAVQRFFDSIGLKTQRPAVAGMTQDPVPVPPSVGLGAGIGIGTGLGRNPGGEDQKVGSGSSTNAAAGTDYNRIFKGSDVTTKARVLSKPEPQYTESARKYAVQGTVVLRAVFTSSGQVTNIRVVRRLPHGLTERAVAAARQIRFNPALKDEHPVSMFIQLEYNFNLY